MQTNATQRQRACKTLLTKTHAIIDAEGATEAALQKVKALLIALANRTELFPPEDFAQPEAQGRTHVLIAEPNDGLGLNLTIQHPGKIAAPHDHGIWCVNASISGAELHRFYRRTDDAKKPGHATIEEIGQAKVAPGLGMAMTDHTIHSTEILGNTTAYGLALYGYALARFPSVLWYNPEFNAVRAMPSRRAA